MKAKLLWVLMVLNALLLISLIGRFSGGDQNAAYAQPLRAGEFIMVPGQITGQPSGVVFFVDTTNGILGAMSYDHSRQQLNTMAPIDLNRIFGAEREQ